MTKIMAMVVVVILLISATCCFSLPSKTNSSISPQVLDKLRQVLMLEDTMWCLRPPRYGYDRPPLGYSTTNGLQVKLELATKGIYGVGLLVKFSIGNPPVPQLALMDTGTNLIRLQCMRCKDCKDQQQGPIFNASNSTTYFSLPSSCDSKGSCFGVEQLILETSANDSKVISPVPFICDFENNQEINKFRRQWNGGVFGLGKSINSIVAKLSRRFSYCIGNINDRSYSFNSLSFGKEAIIEGQSTPFESGDGLYYLTLEGISIGGVRLDVDLGAFGSSSAGGRAILDSGTTFTFLPEAVYKNVAEKISSMLEGVLEQVLYHEKEPWLLCYNGNASQDLEGFPVMTFHFADGADLVLDSGSLFYHEQEGVFCVSIRPNPSTAAGSSVIGIMAQQHYNVAYELNEKRIYFLRIDCQLLDD